MTTHRERLEDCLAGRRVDRVPVAFWRHFPVDDQTAEGQAEAHLAFQRTYDLDLVKVSPESSFCLRDWGARDEWRGATEGTRTYTHWVIQDPGDWEMLPVLDPHQGSLGLQLDCLRLLVKALHPDTPVIQTIFNPLSQAKNLVGGDRLHAHLRLYPDAVHAGLQVIAESTRRFIEAARETGIDGIFYAVQHAQYGLLSPAEYEAFGRRYDLPLLAATDGLWLNLLHLHGEEVMFDLFLDYPVQVINWHDQETPPSLPQALERFPGAVCGGIRREETLVLGDPGQVAAEARHAIEQTGGRRFILGTGCVVPIIAPYGNLMAARRTVEQPSGEPSRR